MSKPTFIKMLLLSLLPALACGVAFVVKPSGGEHVALPKDRNELFRSAVAIPGGWYELGSREIGCHPPRRVELPCYYIWPVEVPLSWWRAYRGENEAKSQGDLPVFSVSYNEAEAFCRWFSSRYGVTTRLPSVDEWEAAAQCGTAGIPFPWGWDNPESRAVMNADSAELVAGRKPNPWGLYDMAGNVAEWCRTGSFDEEKAYVMGGSWAERKPENLRISQAMSLPKSYRDADVGFRIVIEGPAQEQK